MQNLITAITTYDLSGLRPKHRARIAFLLKRQDAIEFAYECDQEQDESGDCFDMINKGHEKQYRRLHGLFASKFGISVERAVDEAYDVFGETLTCRFPGLRAFSSRLQRIAWQEDMAFFDHLNDAEAGVHY